MRETRSLKPALPSGKGWRQLYHSSLQSYKPLFQQPRWLRTLRDWSNDNKSVPECLCMPLCMETNGLTSRARQLLLLTQTAGRLSYDVWIRIINMESLFTFIIYLSICMYPSAYLYMYQYMHVCKYTRARTHVYIILYHIFYLTSSYAFLRRPIFTCNVLSLSI